MSPRNDEESDLSYATVSYIYQLEPSRKKQVQILKMTMHFNHT